MVPQRSTGNVDGLVSSVADTTSSVGGRRPGFGREIMSSPGNLGIASLHKSKEDHHHQMMSDFFHKK